MIVAGQFYLQPPDADEQAESSPPPGRRPRHRRRGPARGFSRLAAAGRTTSPQPGRLAGTRRRHLREHRPRAGRAFGPPAEHRSDEQPGLVHAVRIGCRFKVERIGCRLQIADSKQKPHCYTVSLSLPIVTPLLALLHYSLPTPSRSLSHPSPSSSPSSHSLSQGIPPHDYHSRSSSRL